MRARGHRRDAQLHALSDGALERIHTNNAIERLNREIGRSTRVVGSFSDSKSALMPLHREMKYVADNEWGSRRNLDVTLLDE